MTKSSKGLLFGLCSFLVIVGLLYTFNKDEEKNGLGSDGLVEKSSRSVNRQVPQEKVPSFEELMKLHSPVEAFELWARSAGPAHPDYHKNAISVVHRFDSIVDAKDFVVGLENVEARTHLAGELVRSWLRKDKTSDALAFLDSVPYGASREKFLSVLYKGGDLSEIIHHMESHRGGKDLEFGAISALLARDDIQKSEGESVAKNIFSFIKDGGFSSEDKLLGLKQWVEAFKDVEDLTTYFDIIAAGDFPVGSDPFSTYAYPVVLRAIFDKSPGKAIDLFNQTSESLSAQSSNYVLNSLVAQYSQKDLRSCLEWISEMDDEMKSRALRSIVVGSDISTQQMKEVAQQVGLSSEGLRMLVSKVESRTLPSDIEKRNEAWNASAKEVSAMVTPGARDLGLNKFLKSLEQSEDFSSSEKESRKHSWINFAAMSAPREIAQFLADDPELLKITGAAERIASGYYEVSPREAIAWAHEVEGFSADLKVSEGLQKKWIGADPAGYARWLNEQEPGELRDESTFQLVDWLAQKSAKSEAIEWIEKIDDPALKDKALGKIDEARNRNGE